MTGNDRNDEPRRDTVPEEEKRPDPKPARQDPPETARDPVPGIGHEPEPDGENLIPAKDRPGTL